MKLTTLSVAILASCTPLTTGADPVALTCQVPEAAREWVGELCVSLQEEERIAPEDCLYEFLRRGVQAYSGQRTRRAAQADAEKATAARIEKSQNQFPPAVRVEESTE